MKLFFHVLVVLVLLSISTLHAQSFGSFLARLMSLPESARQAEVESLLTAHPVLPLLDNDSTVVFLFHGMANSVALAGDMNGWDPKGESFSRASTTNLWYLKRNYRSSARLDYKLVLNDGTWILDPGNPRTMAGGFGANSELRMPKYLPSPWTEHQTWTETGLQWDSVLTSAHLPGSRSISIYLPPRLPADGASLGVALFHDGPDYLSLGRAITSLDNLINSGSIRPIIGIFLTPVNREAEYAGSLKEAYVRFITEEVLPFVRKRFSVPLDSAGLATFGVSNGGNISLYMGTRYPTLFSRVSAQSSNVESSILADLRARVEWPVDLVLDVGEYDLPILISRVRSLAALLRDKHISFQYQEPPEGHSWGNWLKSLPEILLHFFPSKVLQLSPPIESEDHSLRMDLYPNPCGNQLFLAITSPRNQNASIAVYSSSGLLLYSLPHARLLSPVGVVTLPVRGYPPMLCFAVCTTETGSQVVAPFRTR